MVTLAGISFIQELIFYYGLRSVLPSSGLMSRIFVLPSLVFLLKAFVDKVFTFGQVAAQIFVVLAIVISFTAQDGLSSFETLPLTLLMISALLYSVQISVQSALFKIDSQISTLYMMGIVAFCKCVFSAFTFPALKIWEGGDV